MEQSPETPAVPEAPKPSAAERRAAIETGQKTKRRKGFIMGLFVGQLLIVGIDLGFHFLIPIIEKRYQFHSPIPIQSLVFIGMTAGIFMTGLLIFFILGLQGAGYVLGKKKVGFFTAVGRGMKRVFKAAWALGLTLGVIGGTAWFMIPGPSWKPTQNYLVEQKDKAVDKAKTFAEDLLKKKPAPETPPQ
jgi:hypothetical protein